MKRLGTSLVFASVIAAFASGQQVSVDYVQGVVDVYEDGSWYELFIGEQLDADDRVRLGSNAYAELSTSSANLRLTKPGTYELSELVSASQSTEQADLGNLLRGRISRMLSADARGQAVGGGARASEAATQPTTQWAGGESVGELIEEGIELIAEADFEEAYFVFEEAYDFASSANLPEAAYYFGYSAWLLGDTLDALELLEEFPLDPETSFYVDHALTLGQAYVETFAYDNADEVLSPLLDNDELSEADRQMALLMLGLSARGRGNASEAEDFLSRAVSLAPDSEIGRTASSLRSDG
jgi:hypothetical protein